jgi:hypothetical protein
VAKLGSSYEQAKRIVVDAPWHRLYHQPSCTGGERWQSLTLRSPRIVILITGSQPMSGRTELVILYAILILGGKKVW